MKNILKVFKRDIKGIFKNPITLLIIGGLCFMPSLYAWVNIHACWNPYENTGSVPVAIVNNDKGSTMAGKDINIGKQVVQNLKDNKKIGWKFVNTKEANLGVIGGKYYAMVEIPENFSKDLTSLTSANPVKPEIIYKVDTKANPVAGKITSVAQGKLVEQITTSFIDTVNTVVFSKLNEVGKDITKNKDNIIKLKNAIISINKNMDFITNELSSLSSNSNNLGTYLNSLKTTLPAITSTLNSVDNNTDNTKNLVASTKENLNSSFSNLKVNLNSIKAVNENIGSLATKLNNSDNNSSSGLIVSQISNDINSINSNLNTNIIFLESINKFANNKKISDGINSLKDVQNSLNGLKSSVTNIQNDLKNGSKLSNESISIIKNKFNNMSNQINGSLIKFSEDVMPSLNIIGDNLIEATTNASKLLNTAKGMVPQINNLLDSGIDGSQLAAKTSNDLGKRLNEFKGSIGTLSDELSKLSDGDLIKIIGLLQNKPDVMGSFVATPFNLKKEAIYKVPNYGSGMAPIYSVLALWVGALLLNSLLTTNCRADFEGSEKLSIREKHFGKMLTFVVLSIVQALIVSIGDKVLLKVHTVNAPLMIIFAVVCSITFTIIVFTFTSLFGNVGKGLAIVFMIIQIAGCGGTYPIQVDPKFFRIMQPLFPFTYGVDGFREAIAGPLISHVALDFVALFIFAIVFILLGFFLKPLLNEKVQRFEYKFKNSHISE